MKRQTTKFAGFVFLILIVVAFGFWAFFGGTMKQNSTQLTPSEVLEIFESSGYLIDHLEYDIKYSGPLGEIGHYIQLTIYSSPNQYGMRIIQFENWREARKSAKFIVNLDKQMDGNLASAFHFGNVMIEIWPTDEAFSAELRSVLENAE